MDVVLDLPMDEKIPVLYVVVAMDEKGNEGIMDMNGHPLVFGHKSTLEKILPNLQKIATGCKKTIRLVKFSKRETIQEMKP